MSSLPNPQRQTCCNRMCTYYAQTTIPSSQFRNHLCQFCIQQYDRGQYCLYCQQIYDQSTDDGKQWIMCDKCLRWTHTDCADIQVKGDSSCKVVYKCIKCRQTQVGYNPNGRKRISQPGKTGPKVIQKKGDVFLNGIDFYWQLKPQEIAADLQKIQSYLQ